jgi:hypothetical protein
MDFIITNFPLVLIAVVAINAAIARGRVTRFIEARGGEEAGAIRYVWSAAGIVAGYLLLIDAAGHLFGSNSRLCFIPASHPQAAADYIAWAIWVGVPLALTIWTWLLGGAAILARYSPLYSRYFHPEIVYGEWLERAFMLFVLAVAIFVPLGVRHARTPLPTCGAPIQMQSPSPRMDATQR